MPNTNILPTNNDIDNMVTTLHMLNQLSKDKYRVVTDAIEEAFKITKGDRLVDFTGADIREVLSYLKGALHTYDV